MYQPPIYLHSENMWETGVLGPRPGAGIQRESRLIPGEAHHLVVRQLLGAIRAGLELGGLYKVR